MTFEVLIATLVFLGAVIFLPFRLVAVTESDDKLARRVSIAGFLSSGLLFLCATLVAIFGGRAPTADARKVAEQTPLPSFAKPLPEWLARGENGMWTWTKLGSELGGQDSKAWSLIPGKIGIVLAHGKAHGIKIDRLFLIADGKVSECDPGECAQAAASRAIPYLDDRQDALTRQITQLLAD